MRSINVKKLVAIAGGAALLGAAAAPMVGAAVNLQKSDIYAANGSAAVDIVVGTNGADVSDYMAAANIARAISSNAVTTKEVSLLPGGSTGTANVSNAVVKIKVGGTTTVSQDAKQFLDMNVLSKDGTVAEIKDQNVGDAFFKTFANESKDYTIDRAGSTSSSYTNIEQVRLTANMLFDATDSDIEDFVTYIEKGDLRYLSLIQGGNNDINAGYTDNGDANYLPVNFLGKPYVINSITTSAVVLVSDNPARSFEQGESFEAVGVNGEKYKVVVSNIYTATSNTVELELYDSNDTKVATTNGTSGTLTFRKNGQELLSTVISIDSIGSRLIEGGSQLFFARLIVGADRLEIRNNQPFPFYTGADDTDWEGHLLFKNTNQLIEIGVKNDKLAWGDENPLVSATQSFNTALGPSSIKLFEGTDVEELGTVTFKGFYTQGVNFTDVSFTNDAADVDGVGRSYGSIKFTTSDSVEHNIPALLRLNTSSDATSVYNFTFAGKKYSYTFDRTNDIFTLKQGELTSTTFAGAAVDVNVPILLTATPGGVGDTSAVATDQNVTLSNSQGNFSVRYVLKRGRTTSGTKSDDIYLALRAQDFGALEWSAGTLSFIGTVIDNNAASPWAAALGVATMARDSNVTGAGQEGIDLNFGVGWYMPSMTDWNGINPANAPNFYRFALFRLGEGSASTNVPGAGTSTTHLGKFTVLIDTEDGWAGTVDTTADSRTGYSNNGTAVHYNAGVLDINLLLSEDNDTSDYAKVWTDYGTKAWVKDREAYFTLPSALMKGYLIVAPAGTTEVTTGGTDFEVGWGKSVTINGTTVSVDGITGATVTGGTVDANAPSTTTVTVPAPANGRPMVKSDQTDYSSTVVLVGGPFVNRLSAQLTGVDDLFQSAGNVAPVELYTSSNGTKHILVAGYSAADTTQAANELIAFLNSLE